MNENLSDLEKLALKCISTHGPEYDGVFGSTIVSDQIPQDVRLKMAEAVAQLPAFVIWSRQYDGKTVSIENI